MGNKLKPPLKDSENQTEFNELLGNEIETISGHENVKQNTGTALFQGIFVGKNLNEQPLDKKGAGWIFENNEYEKLLNKPNMTLEDNANMEKCIKFLVNNKMATSENLNKLEAIKYGLDYREIAWLKFSREKLIPQVKFNDEVNNYGVFESEEKNIYKTMYNGNSEYYLSADQYRDQAKKQWKIAIEDTHIRKALKALPWEFSENNRYIWANILWNILNLSMSGYVLSDCRLWDRDDYGCLSSAPAGKVSTRAFRFHGSGGALYNDSDFHYGRDLARPCLFLIK